MDDHDELSRQSRASAPLRTRSQAAPGWTAQESLTLVNEIAAIEGDCRKTFSSFQKWKIIVENCNALDVNRTFNQCRRQWESLLSAYKKIKKWESSSSASRVGSYWSLGNERRKGFGFLEDFDPDVFKAIENWLKADDGSGTDPESDPEAVADGLDVIADYGFKKQRHRTLYEKSNTEERPNPQIQSTNKKLMSKRSNAEEMTKLPLKRRKDEKKVTENRGIEDKEQIMFAELRQNAELITAIVGGNLDESSALVLADQENAEASQTAFTRRQGDQIIACLGNLSDTLNQLYDLVQGCG